MKLTELNTDAKSYKLADICVEGDVQFGLGSTLTLDWLIDNYVAMEYERRVEPKLLYIYEKLKTWDHTDRCKFQHFNDMEAYWIPHDSLQVMVMGKTYGPRYLVIRKEQAFTMTKWTSTHVRMIWPRTRRNCINNVDQPTLSYYKDRDFDMSFGNDGCLYGDSRDPGHILTFENYGGIGKGCDHAHWDLAKTTRWFFDVGCLHTNIREARDDA